MDMKPDLFILAIGENVPDPETPEMQELFQKKVTEFLTFIKEAGCPNIIVRSTFWPRESIDEPLRKACEAIGGIYVDIRALAKEENYARSERSFQHDGVAIHPGDRGMKAIADAIWKALPQNTNK
jgi:alpha-galactosidase